MANSIKTRAGSTSPAPLVSITTTALTRVASTGCLSAATRESLSRILARANTLPPVLTRELTARGSTHWRAQRRAVVEFPRHLRGNACSSSMVAGVLYDEVDALARAAQRVEVPPRRAFPRSRSD